MRSLLKKNVISLTFVKFSFIVFFFSKHWWLVISWHFYWQWVLVSCIVCKCVYTKTNTSKINWLNWTFRSFICSHLFLVNFIMFFFCFRQLYMLTIFKYSTFFFYCVCVFYLLVQLVFIIVSFLILCSIKKNQTRLALLEIVYNSLQIKFINSLKKCVDNFYKVWIIVFFCGCWFLRVLFQLKTKIGDNVRRCLFFNSFHWADFGVGGRGFDQEKAIRN